MGFSICARVRNVRHDTNLSKFSDKVNKKLARVISQVSRRNLANTCVLCEPIVNSWYANAPASPALDKLSEKIPYETYPRKQIHDYQRYINQEVSPRNLISWTPAPSPSVRL